MITDKEFNIRTLSNSQPHKDYGGWLGFLKTCEARRWEYGVIFYGSVNCNYILFPNGTVICNYGYNGHALMNRIAELGWEAVYAKIIEWHNKYEALINGISQLWKEA